jgi:hypothetical protein
VRARRPVIAGVFVALLGLVFTGSAQACSCAHSTPSESMARADAAIVGRLVSVSPRGDFRAVYRYRVRRVYRGRGKIKRGRILAVHSSRSAAACALPHRIRRVYGLFLVRDGSQWVSGICGIVSPRDLWSAARHRVRIYRRSSPGGSCPT